MPPPEVHAAGGVIVREARVAVVHRPHRADWSLPKGKLEPGEPSEAAAVREVLEETGLSCTPGDELPEIRYRDHRNRPKTVRYWLMTVDEGTFAPNDEVDELRWLSGDEATALLSYEDDRHLVRWVVERGAIG